MSKDYELTWPGHPNIYIDSSPRDLTFYFSEPENGVNNETGMLLLIPGFGGNAKSNVYKKMRSIFADQYNLVTVQCDYFGQEFMQGSQSVNLNISKDELSSVFSDNELKQVYLDGFNASAFLEIGSKYNLNVTVKETLKESLDNFNDMGLMQAIDNLTALHYVIKILEDNGLSFNTKKVILFGQSHGAYLSYLCNALSPNLFSLLIDNSAWIFPVYLSAPRYLTNKIGNMNWFIEFNYRAGSLAYDGEFLDLQTLYELFENKCKIVCYHGTTDNLISHVEKQSFCEKIANCTLYEIGEVNVDGKVFKSTNHGLDADFLMFFEYVMSKSSFDKSTNLHLEPYEIETTHSVYNIFYKNGMPVVSVNVK